MGNARSVKNSLKKINIDSEIITNPDGLENSCGIVLPGVGSFNKAVKNLKSSNLFQKINISVTEKKIPYLGICLGMQLIAENSSENKPTRGFGWIKGEVRKIKTDDQIRLPHVGWNQIEINSDSKLLSRGKNYSNYYFDHSYALSCDAPDRISSMVSYGKNKIISSIEFGNIFGTQFHPEKSQLNGLRVLKAFSEIVRINK